MLQSIFTDWRIGWSYSSKKVQHLLFRKETFFSLFLPSTSTFLWSCGLAFSVRKNHAKGYPQIIALKNSSSILRMRIITSIVSSVRMILQLICISIWFTEKNNGNSSSNYHNIRSNILLLSLLTYESFYTTFQITGQWEERSNICNKERKKTRWQCRWGIRYWRKWRFWRWKLNCACAVIHSLHVILSAYNVLFKYPVYSTLIFCFIRIADKRLQIRNRVSRLHISIVIKRNDSKESLTCAKG